jgi:hypothetical protein
MEIWVDSAESLFRGTSLHDSTALEKLQTALLLIKTILNKTDYLEVRSMLIVLKPFFKALLL